MKIVPYDAKYRQEFIDMNKHWISELFLLEEADIAVLDNIDGILADGG